jgi:cbb3-type cytochrome c oxidase subunit III
MTRGPLLAALALPAVALAAGAKMKTPKTPAGDLKAGAALYAAKCAVCHGEKGEGNKAMAVVPLTDPKMLKQFGTEKKLRDVILKGMKGKKMDMPGYRGQLSDKQLRDLVAYTWTLQHPPKKKR